MKTNANLKCLFVILFIASQDLASHAAGTIAFGNGALTRIQWGVGSVPGPTVVGVFWGTNRDDLTLVLPLGTVGLLSGVISAPSASVYPIPGTEAGQTVYMQIRGWDARHGTNWMDARYGFGGYGVTDIRQVTLGLEAGPGRVIWQTATGTLPSRFNPLILRFPSYPPASVRFISANQPVIVDVGRQGTVDAIISVVRYGIPQTSPNLDFISTVMISTTNGTAFAYQDYVPVNVMLTFNPGETLQHVRIKILANAQPEPDEQFGVYLRSTASPVQVYPYVLSVTIREARVHLARMEAGNPVLSFLTTTSQSYILESSTNLLFWTLVPGAEDIKGTGNEIQFKDFSFDCCRHRFYRSQLVP